MSTTTTQPPPQANGDSTLSPTSSPRKLKILMLHGYTQSGPLFHSKTRSLEKQLHKAFPPLPSPSTIKPSKSPPSSPISLLYPGGLSLIYPTGPMPLHPSDIPGYTPSPSEVHTEDAEPEAYGWWRRETGGEKYVGLETGLDIIAETIKQEGGIDGVIGFSQGGCMATFVASLLEDRRMLSFSSSSSTPYPLSFQKLQDSGIQGPLKFAIIYSGFYAPSTLYSPFYNPSISTPTLHFIGTLDTVVEEWRAVGLVERCERATREVVRHPGGHFVPTGREMVGVLVGWMGGVLLSGKEEKGKAEEEESVEDMDVPF